MISSSPTGADWNGHGTTTDAAVQVLSGSGRSKLWLINRGAYDGFFSLDGGTTWAFMPTGFVIELPLMGQTFDLRVKRIPGKWDLMAVFAFAE